MTNATRFSAIAGWPVNSDTNSVKVVPSRARIKISPKRQFFERNSKLADNNAAKLRNVTCVTVLAGAYLHDLYRAARLPVQRVAQFRELSVVA